MNRFHAISRGHWTRIGPKSLRVNAGQGRSNAQFRVAVEIVGRAILLTTPGASEAGSNRGSATSVICKHFEPGSLVSDCRHEAKSAALQRSHWVRSTPQVRRDREQLTLNQRVASSSPAAPTTLFNEL